MCSCLIFHLLENAGFVLLPLFGALIPSYTLAPFFFNTAFSTFTRFGPARRTGRGKITYRRKKNPHCTPGQLKSDCHCNLLLDGPKLLHIILRSFSLHEPTRGVGDRLTCALLIRTLYQSWRGSSYKNRLANHLCSLHIRRLVSVITYP